MRAMILAILLLVTAASGGCLRERRTFSSPQERDEYYRKQKEITEYLNNKYGQASTVTLSTDEMLEMGRIDKQYDNMLIEVFGETSFNDYKKFKDSFNKKLIEDGKMEYTIQF